MVGDYPFTNLVFEGGGVKGIAYVGALRVLAERGVLAQVTAVAGTSAGAITACLVAVGYTPEELETTMLALDLTRFEDGRLEGPVRVVEKYGWFRGDAFLSWLRAQISFKLGSPDATFNDLHGHTGVDLRVVATDLSTGLPMIFSLSTTPDQELAGAVRMSMSIPLFFAAVQSAGSVFADGGAVWNYPIEMFDDGSPNMATLGLHLGLRGKTPPPPRHIHDLVEYVKRLYDAVTRVQSDYFERSASDVARSVFIDDLGLSATDFAISQTQKEALIGNGATAMTAFLDSLATPTQGGK